MQHCNLVHCKSAVCQNINDILNHNPSTKIGVIQPTFLSKGLAELHLLNPAENGHCQLSNP